MATMNLADPELELIDPTPNVQMLFIQFDKIFFWTKLASRAVVRWSKRMYSCAGICSYEGRGGLCDIALSEPLLKLRPRKDLIETLLHEMIHAFLFITSQVQDRDGHGPNFQAHMHRINRSASLNISIYHDFHDEVKLYQTHWWRCDGPCQRLRPHFGIVRRSVNRAPGPSDYWWSQHQQKCGGIFKKIKEPESKKPGRKTATNTENAKKNVTKPNADITKYITNNNTPINSVPKSTPVLKDSNVTTINAINKKNNNPPSTFVVGKKIVIFNPTGSQQLPVFTGTGHTINNNPLSDHRNVTEHVRNIWAAKQLPPAINKVSIKNPEPNKFIKEPGKNVIISNPNKQKATTTDICSPPAKIKKIDDYFKATSLLKDLYGEDFKLTQPQNNAKLVAVSVKVELVDCPVCSAKIDKEAINSHLDECLNKEVLEKLTQDNPVEVDNKEEKYKLPPIPAFNVKQHGTHIDLTNLKDFFNMDDFNDNPSKDNKSDKRRSDSPTTVQSINMYKKQDEKNNNVQPVNNIRKSDNFVSKERGDFNSILKINNSRKSAVPVKKSEIPVIKIEKDIEPQPSTSRGSEPMEQICPCCGKKCNQLETHLDECLAFFDSNATIPEEGGSTSVGNVTTIIIDDDEDIFDESQIFNETGTKTPCPVCMEMVEESAMNDHLDYCLGLS